VKNDRKPPLNSRLRDARLERGWSQQQLADLVGTTFVNVSRWENGSNFPIPYFRQKLCQVFGKTPAELGLVPPLPHASRVWNVPFTHNPFFTGREDLLALLHERLSTARMAALTQAQALYGLGGIGKTQTAAEYTFRYGDEYAHVFWTWAATRETLDADFAKLAQLLDLPEKGEQDQSQVVAAVKRWLAAHEDWLLVLDNADDLPLAREFLPPRHNGYVLFTTRAQAAGAIAASIEVEQLTLQEGTLLLLRLTKLLDKDSSLDKAQAEDRAAAERIVEEMDGLPLALVQAGAYVEETGCSLADYLRIYATHHKELLVRHSRLMLDYPKTVATTWSLSFQHIEQQGSAAADVLRLCAFLAPDAIPEELLMRGIAEPGADPGAEAGDPFKLNEALEALRRYSLVRREVNEKTHIISIHRLVQTVLKDSMDLETQRAWAARTVQTVNAVFPETGSGIGEKQHYFLHYYLPHVQVCAALISRYHLHSQEAARLLYQAGIFLYVHGFYSQSQALLQQGLAIREQIFGSEHPAVAESLTVLAMLASNRGEYGQAEQFYQQALVIREKMFGPDHPDTTRSRNNLGVIYRSQGKYELAEQLLQRALSISEQALGFEHLDTLNFVINLAKLYAEQHKYEKAEQLLKQALATGERVLEPGHPLIAHNLNLLARLWYEQGNYELAEALWKRSLALFEKTLGSEHPAAAERLNDLAELYFAQGRYGEAQSFCQRALSISEKILGSGHPDTIVYREHLNRIVNKIKGEQDREHHPIPPSS
jgi:tetratricopeptide (TPR) repeat protein/DNA-binding XRE family transcriptional regulator